MNALEGKVTSIKFTVDESDRAVRFILNPNRDEMYAQGGDIVDLDDAKVLWSDDYMFVIDQMMVDESEVEDAYNWALMVTECDKWWCAENGVTYRTKSGTVIRARASTMPCNMAHGKRAATVCAECGKEIGIGESYLEVADNFLQIKYFDRREDAVFCCEDCLIKALSVERRVCGEEN